MKLGQTIVGIRKKKGMTQEEFSKIFHVTRQTVSNWEKEKSYPDLQTLVNMSNEFEISLDIMLKEDKQMVKRVSFDIKFGKYLKNILLWVAIIVFVSGIVWAVIWNKTKTTLEKKFQTGIEKNDFIFDEQLGYYTKKTDDNTYYKLPNQKMTDFWDFHPDFYAKYLDCYTELEGETLWMRWSGKDDNDINNAAIFCVDQIGNITYTFTAEEKEKLLENNPEAAGLVKDAESIYDSVYK